MQSRVGQEDRVKREDAVHFCLMNANGIKELLHRNVRRERKACRKNQKNSRPSSFACICSLLLLSLSLLMQSTHNVCACRSIFVASGMCVCECLDGEEDSGVAGQMKKRRN